MVLSHSHLSVNWLNKVAFLKAPKRKAVGESRDDWECWARKIEATLSGRAKDWRKDTVLGLRSWDRKAERRVVPEINCLLWEFTFIWILLKALLFSLEEKKITHSNIHPFSPPPPTTTRACGRQTSSYPLLQSGRSRDKPPLNWCRSFLFPVFVVPLENFPCVSAEPHRLLEHQKNLEESC